MDEIFSINALLARIDALGVVLFFEIILRILQRLTTDSDGKPKYTLLSPIYFCMITPVFYLGLWLFRVNIADAQDNGYFFPPLDAGDNETSTSLYSSILNEDLFDIWRVIDLRTVSWSAMFDAIPTLIALTLFSLIHVPINIPAFAISTDTEADMNNELVAHGYSNLFAGIFGGLQNVSSYSPTSYVESNVLHIMVFLSITHFSVVYGLHTICIVRSIRWYRESFWRSCCYCNKYVVFRWAYDCIVYTTMYGWKLTAACWYGFVFRRCLR